MVLYIKTWKSLHQEVPESQELQALQALQEYTYAMEKAKIYGKVLPDEEQDSRFFNMPSSISSI